MCGPLLLQAALTVVVSVAALGEAAIAVGLSAWLLVRMGPSLLSCTHHPASPTECSCSSGFVDPPSLVREVQLFAAASECGLLGTRILRLHYLLLGLYCVGVALAIAMVATAGKHLHSLGLFGKSGIYTVSEGW